LQNYKLIIQKNLLTNSDFT